VCHVPHSSDGRNAPVGTRHHSSDKTAAVGHLPVPTVGYRSLLQRHIVVVWYGMQLDVVELGQQCVELHGPNKMWVNYNLVIMA
jgi:hypothetical protein